MLQNVRHYSFIRFHPRPPDARTEAARAYIAYIARTEDARAYISYMLQTPTLRYYNSLRRKSEDGTHT